MERNFLIVRPKYGLCNQLLAISKSIIFAIISNRDIIYHSFQLDYRNTENICNFHDVIDIDHLQKIMNNISIKIYSKMEDKGVKIITTGNQDISLIKDFIPFLTDNNNKNEKYLIIDNPISANIPNEYIKLLNYINLNIKFTEKYIKIAHDIKTNLNLTNYICIHLRLENDAINFIKDQQKKGYGTDFINNIYKNKYIDELNLLMKYYPNKKIYICTSIGTDTDTNADINIDFYNNIKNKYKLIDKNNFIDKKSTCREIYGIIDFIIAKDSDHFIGADWSSFSIYLYEHNISKKKTTKLIDIWKTINNL